MKKLHLICNAHLDPCWMWNYDEGAGAALATFYSAAVLADEFDYIFCHNEAVLYEYIQKYDAKLFERIKELVRAGKWHIMGGWYCQPDCNLPSGESVIRQIKTGREYFDKNFGIRPTTAVNFDSFGHSRGLVQILKKCGYDSYVFCRPMPELLDLQSNLFIWTGYDGSEIKALRVADDTIYCSGLGTAVKDILRKISYIKDDIGFVAWGVGNHGGGPSRKDLAGITKLIEEKKDECKIVHSTPEDYFREAQTDLRFSEPLRCLVKSYSSTSDTKQKHMELENSLYLTEKICSLADIEGVYEYDRGSFIDAEKCLALSEFHDVLSGDCLKEGQENTVMMMNHARELLNREFMKAFMALAGRYRQAEEGHNPFIIYNPEPFRYETVVETEILMLNSICDDETEYVPTVYKDGAEIPCQVIHEHSLINYDRRKRIAYKVNLEPLGLTRVDAVFDIKTKKIAAKPSISGDIVIEDSVKKVIIGRKTGLIEAFYANGINYLSGPSFMPVMFSDNGDPFGWGIEKLGTDYTDFTFGTGTCAVLAGLPDINITEDGPVLTEIQSVFTCGNSCAVMTYKIYKDLPYVDVSAYVLWNEQSKGLKFKIQTAKGGKYFAQVAYGTEYYMKDGRENIAQRFLGADYGKMALSVYNDRSSYGTSMDGNSLYITALNGSAWCAHPIGDRPLFDDVRFIPYIEQGRHEFTYRIQVNPVSECEKYSQMFAQKPYSVNMYPHGDGNVLRDAVYLDNPDITMTAFYKKENGEYVIRLFNNSDTSAETMICVLNTAEKVNLGPYEFTTLIYNKDSSVLKESGNAAEW